MGKKECVCGFTCERLQDLRAHRKGCAVWKDQLGRCAVCSRRHYRHNVGCPNVGEDNIRHRLLKKHDMNPAKFEAFLRVLKRQYRNMVGLKH